MGQWSLTRLGAPALCVRSLVTGSPRWIPPAGLVVVVPYIRHRCRFLLTGSEAPHIPMLRLPPLNCTAPHITPSLQQTASCGPGRVFLGGITSTPGHRPVQCRALSHLADLSMSMTFFFEAQQPQRNRCRATCPPAVQRLPGTA